MLHRYNSVFFSSFATNSYNVLYATPDFVDGGSYDTEKWLDKHLCNVTQIQREAASWQRLDNAACIETYADDLLNQYRNVILVVSNLTMANNSLLDILGYDNGMKKALSNGQARFPYQWICDDPNLRSKIEPGPRTAESYNMYSDPCYTVVSKLEAVADQWSSHGFAIQHCLAEKVTEACTLNFSLEIAIVVMAFNLVKILCMSYVAFRIRDHPLITLGDAVESFIRTADETSKGLCLLSRRQVVSAWDESTWYVNGGRQRDLDRDPVTFRAERHKWSSAASSARWDITLLL